MVPNELTRLENNLVFAAFLLGLNESLGLTFMEDHLSFQTMQSLPNEIQDQYTKFCNIRPAHSIDDDALLSHDIPKTACCRVYEDHGPKFQENIKELWNRLFKKKGSLVASRMKEAEDEFVNELKKKMSMVKSDNLVTRHIEELRANKTLLGFFSCPRQVELKMKVSIEEEHPFNIVYRAYELAPMRRDMSDISSNCGRAIVPTCGESVELAAINPQHERLFKVIILKSGELLIFIHNFTHSCLNLYRCSKVGFSNKGRPVHIFRRGFDLLAVDEATRSMALYEKERSKIVIFRFDESFRKVFSTGVEVNLESCKGSKNIIWMHLIPGKMELLLVDDSNRARVAEIHEKPMMKPKHISLPLQQHSSLRACVSVDGYFFLVFRQLQGQGEDIDVEGTSHSCPENTLEIYVLGDTMSYLKTIHFNARECRVSDLEQLGVKIAVFGSQSQLFLYSPADAPGSIFSYVLKTALARKAVQLQQVDQIKAPENETEIAGACPYLGYIYHIFDKFLTTPKLFPSAKKCITFEVVLECSRSDRCNGD